MKTDLNFMPKNNRNDHLLLLLIFLLLLGIIVLVHGCKPVQKTNNQTLEIAKKDSANTNVIKSSDVFDSSTLLPEVKINSVIANPCDSFGKLKPINQTIDNGKAHVKIITLHDTLHVDCNCDATINRLRIEKYKSDSSYTNLQKVAERLAKYTVTTKIEKEIPWYVYLGLAGLALIILILLLYIVKLKVF